LEVQESIISNEKLKRPFDWRRINPVGIFSTVKSTGFECDYAGHHNQH
jgi:hypothetical protein